MALAATTALGVGLLIAPASVAAGPAPSAGPARAALTDQQQSILNARQQARSIGKPVVVDALTTETSQTTANPNGRLTTSDFLQPVRTKRGTAWADLDTTLRRNSDGTLSPAVTTNALTVSGGGDGPLATIATADGKKLAVTAPFTLPAPTLSGDTASYRDVLPDVDLQLTALPDGGWRDVIVVHTATAAADVRLKTLHFPVQATGLSVATDKAGNVSVKDGDGKVRLHAPTPFQWDSSTPKAPVANSKAAKASPRSVAPRAEPTTPAGGSGPRGPGDGATVAKIGIKATDTAIELTPDSETLGKGTGPWYLDPTLTSASGSTQGSLQVQENHPDVENYNSVTNLGTGYCGYSDCTGYGRYRAYYQIAVNPVLYTQPGGAPQPPTIYGSTLYANVVDASSPSTEVPLGLYNTPQIDSHTTWNNQPCGNGMSGCDKVGPSTKITGAGPIDFDVTSMMQTAVARKWDVWTVAIVPDDEDDKTYRKHLSNNPKIVTEYDITPSIWGPATSPSPGFAATNQYNGCRTPGGGASYSPGWVGANQNITLSASSWSPAGFNLHTSFRLWDDNNSQFNWSADSGWLGSFNTATVPVGINSLSDGHQYGWTANATDDILTSSASDSCYFRVDKTSPTVSVSSADFPPSGTPNSSPAKFNTDAGTFTISGTDPAPAGGNASGVACFRWSNNPAPVTGWHCGDPGTVTAGADGTANFSYVPGTWGTNILYVQSQDNAGNYSQPAAYSFYAPWKPGSMPVFGDLTGDGKPDVVLPDVSGNLRLIRPALDGATAAGNVSGSAAFSPTGTWNGVQVTHRASLYGGAPVDDLIAHPAGDPRLYLYKNDGHGNLISRTSFYKSGTTSNTPVTCQDITGAAITCPADFGTDWSNATQILALGTPEGENVSTDANGSHILTRTSLLAVINHQLWLFPPGTTSARLLKPTDTQVSKGNWDNYDLIGPGPANGGSQPTLWARDRINGTIHAYPITKNADGTVNYTALTDPTSGTIPTTSGVTPAAFPIVGSNGDLTGDGITDLWALTADGKLVVWPGRTVDGTAVTPVNDFAGAFTAGDFRAPLSRWKLNEATGSTTAADTTGAHPLTVQGGAAFHADTVGGRSTDVAAFNGTDSALTTGAFALDTTKSFTISLWAKANSSGGVLLSQDGTTASTFQLWPSDRGSGVSEWRFGMAVSDTNGAAIDQTDSTNATARVQFGTWQQLTASYNADTKQLLLFVNGALAGTGLHSTAFQSGGPLVIGRFRNSSAPAAYFNGSAAEVAIHPFASPVTTSAPTVIQSGTGVGKCIDSSNGQTADGNPAQVWDCYPGIAAQSWILNANGTVTNQGHCLDADHGTPANGTHVLLWTCSGGSNQQWLPTGTGGLYNPATGRCLDDPDASTVNGTQLQVWDCYTVPAQHWSISNATPVRTAPLPGT
ncbi:ricin-type beta-trefoil lectin domain protein [Saccharothrix sp. ST-888]|uniref:ricin-type beta-trefoil lectin domain protein n=1 Tax=Saccharothrix sp. ST-888 TaxID=1427391 RepID=UPI0005ED402C|nr:ricin-type beta-trefoil lectin domain protein [Saccharothrix sp. ST-888]KJK58204.1 hypothetical protein UK12_11930 [Saccharothrix sp. ST-888]